MRREAEAVRDAEEAAKVGPVERRRKASQEKLKIHLAATAASAAPPPSPPSPPSSLSPPVAPPPPLSSLASPYIASACFGRALAPQKHVAIAAATAAARRRDSTMHTSCPPRPGSRAVPFLPAAGEESQSAQIAELDPRSHLPREMHPQLQRLEYKALKCDLERQMSRIVDGLHSERQIIAQFKAAALSRALEQQQLGAEGPSMAAPPEVMLVRVRIRA